MYNNSITNWETAYEDFKKDFKLDTQTFKVFAKEKLEKQQLDESTIEQIIKGIISHHTLSMTRDSSFYKHLVEGIHAKRSDLGLTSGDKCALESNIGKAIYSGFACAMSLKIKSKLETMVAINDLTREVRKLNLRVNVVEKRSDHNSQTTTHLPATISPRTFQTPKPGNMLQVTLLTKNAP